MAITHKKYTHDTSSHYSYSTSDSENFFAGITNLLMADLDLQSSCPPSYQVAFSSTTHQIDTQQEPQPNPIVEVPSDDEMRETPAPSSNFETIYLKNNSGIWFSLVDVPLIQWDEKFKEFSVWMDNQAIFPNAIPQLILIDFMSRTTGFIRDWWQSIGDYK